MTRVRQVLGIVTTGATLLASATYGCGDDTSGGYRSPSSAFSAPPSGGEAPNSGNGGLGGPRDSDPSYGGQIFGSVPPPGTDAGTACEPNLTGIVRDFRRGDRSGGHPDFETFVGNGEKGIVATSLGPDGKPVYAPTARTQTTTGKANFDQWYRSVPGVNEEIPFQLLPVRTPDGRLVFDSNAFFPLDGKGFGNEQLSHNYHFTFELHTQFTYGGGEVFNFRGDDDVWAFINNQLVIDLGGVHPAQEASVRVDEWASKLKLVKGTTYPFDIFQAERHTSESNFRIETSIRFNNCAPIIR